jgi:protein O-GlcNAc transferase
VSQRGQRRGSGPHAPKAVALPVPVLLKQGLVLHQTGKLDDAERLYAKILQLQPDHFHAMHLLGVASLQMQRPERGVELIRKAIELNANVASAHSNLGNGLMELKRPEDAMESCDNAIALDPDHAEAHNNRGSAMMDLEHPEDALASCDKAIALNPNYAEGPQQSRRCVAGPEPPGRGINKL